MTRRVRVLINDERRNFHKDLLSKFLYCDASGIVSNADSSQVTSVNNAKRIYELLGGDSVPRPRIQAQTAGSLFEECVATFLNKTFSRFVHLRPGRWDIHQVSSRSGGVIASYAQYAHLSSLQTMLNAHRELAAYLGNDYTVAPDVVVLRHPEADDVINGCRRVGKLVDGQVARASDIRKVCNSVPILHASISCKWTLRSDRAQNARAEALNLIRNRKGGQPHIVVVTAEPTASRLASLALGTGDIDCMYHFALYELQQAVEESGNDEALALLKTMVDGKRLKDISDLPLDLAV